MPAELSPAALAASFGQGHLFTFWDSLNETEQQNLLNDVATVDFERISKLIQVPKKQTNNNIEERLLPPEDNICGCQSELRKSNPALLDKYYETALKAVHEGKVAVLLLAGGQGTRLGVSYPKGLYKPNLPSGRSLYQIQAEKIQRVANLAAKRFDGNGGLYRALHERHIIEDMKSRGVEYVQTYCVDNILVKLPDLHFIGFCTDQDAECGAQVVQKINPKEPIGVLGMVDGRYQVVEYSEISPETAALRRVNSTSNSVNLSHSGRNGPSSVQEQRLLYSHGNICVHFFTRLFLERVSQPEMSNQMRHHVAKKKVTHVDMVTGEIVTPSTPNGVKLEQFIFDVFPQAERFAIWEVLRKERFSPLKNGPDAEVDCPKTSRADYLSYHAKLARDAGAVFFDVNSDTHAVGEANGATTEAILEISPLVTYGGENLDCLAGVEIRGTNVLELDEKTGKPVLIRVDAL
ncbi:unnamed protein product [Echinostoma caproni]|uniref:UDP-N-acetylglucosamine diphosphorylase n=1 Tax=Echinostoma caproni TaxID=27848 RepID=A0A183ANN9_9TREM|nr:unnamed protein product [Echinostoma caproni]